MKKHIKYLIPIFIIVMFLWVPNVFAAENITIESATLTDKSASVSEISEPTLNGLNIGFDLSFSQVNDYAKYKVVINNPTSEDYKVSKSKEFTSSDYLTEKPLTNEEKEELYSSNTSFYYSSFVRLDKKSKKTLTLKCLGKVMDKYSDGSDMYVGTITADEATYAGGLTTSSNSNYYLINKY